MAGRRRCAFRLRPQHQHQRQHHCHAQHRHGGIGVTPAIALQHVQERARPQCTAEIVTAGRNGYRKTAALDEPFGNICQQGAESRSAAEPADGHVHDREHHVIRCVGSAKERRAQGHHAARDGSRHTIAIDQLASDNAADAKAQHHHREGQRGAGAGNREIELKRRQRHYHYVHAGTADGGHGQAGKQARPGVPGIDRRSIAHALPQFARLCADTLWF